MLQDKQSKHIYIGVYSLTVSAKLAL